MLLCSSEPIAMNSLNGFVERAIGGTLVQRIDVFRLGRMSANDSLCLSQDSPWNPIFEVTYKNNVNAG